MSEAAANATASVFDDGRVSLACFEVGGRRLALDVVQVREIVRHQEVTPLPKSPELIEGVIDLRAQVVPVIDLGRALYAEPVVVDDRTRIVVAECDEMVVGLRVAAALDVVSVASAALGDPPALALQAGYEAVRAVVRQPGVKPMLVISVEDLLASVFSSALSGGGSRPRLSGDGL